MTMPTVKKNCVEDPVVTSSTPRDVPTAPNYAVSILFTVPLNICESFEGAVVAFSRPGGANEPTATGTLSDPEDGTMTLNAVFNATPQSTLTVTARVGESELTTNDDSHIRVGY
jgi:hypothetical protein